MYEHLLARGRVGSMTTRNRFVMAGMGVNHTGHFNAGSAAWYGARAKGGFGLIITEYNAVTPEGIAYPGEVVICEDEIPNYRLTTDEVHQYEGAKIFMQIHHAGRQSFSFIQGLMPQATSSVPCPTGKHVVHEMTTEEVWNLIDQYGEAALIAKKANFDGCELHFGHGYLGAAFMSLYLNKRTDEFGGVIENRARFACEVIKKIKTVCGPDFSIGVRISGDEYIPEGRKINETAMFCRLMEAAGADAFNVSLGTYASQNYMMPTAYVPPAFNVDAASYIKKFVKVPVMSVGRMNDPGVMDMEIEAGECDFAILGRASIADAEMPNKVADGKIDEISPCVGCLTRCNTPEIIGTIVPGEFRVSCAFNPFSGFEDCLKIKKSATPKNVVVVGGGVGGLEAAWVSAACGHKVTLFEKTDRLGGNALLAMMPPHKSEIARVITYYTAMCKKYGVDVRLNAEVSAKDILALKPEAVFLATGSTPLSPEFENDGIPVVQSWDVLAGKVVAGENCLIIGGGQVGLETAEYLISQIRTCDIVEMMDHISYDLNGGNRFWAQKILDENKVDRMVNHKVRKFTTDGAICETPNGEVTLSGYDQIILALGFKPYNPLEEEIKAAVKDTFVIGDAGTNGRSLRNAINDAARIAVKL